MLPSYINTLLMRNTCFNAFFFDLQLLHFRGFGMSYLYVPLHMLSSLKDDPSPKKYSKPLYIRPVIYNVFSSIFFVTWRVISKQNSCWDAVELCFGYRGRIFLICSSRQLLTPNVILFECHWGPLFTNWSVCFIINWILYTIHGHRVGGPGPGAAGQAPP
jgi:hypothetical protein